tara:strand:- start:92545 stop:95802 length:3258 start_codon:yes stop_codon:yes gene_type:complete
MNNLNIKVLDQKERNLALDISKSYIVEAPAGSGKTELLIKRYLKLLDKVDNPEEILAITFTKKAAGEMLSRVLDKIKQNPNDKYKIILDNPNSLKIMTIDAFCAYLSKKMPVLSGIGSFCDIAENAEYLYKTAVRNFLKNIKENNYKIHIEKLLLALDNRFDLFESFLVKMLATRDKWMPYIYSVSDLIDQNEIINTIQEIKKNSIYQIEKILTKQDVKILTELLEFAVDNIITNDIQSTQAKNITDNFESLENNFENIYKTISYLLFTGDRKLSFRKRLDKNIGFPPNCKEQKQILISIISKYEHLEDDLGDVISLLRILPDDYNKSEIEFISSLCKILPLLVANLKLVFQNFLKIDFIEVTQAALNALGDNLNPTDLALVLDYKLSHILFDEFQDTSLTHFRLLKKLISEWGNDLNKSIFIVGDPKQSIYKFRQAEVSLFMEVAQNGIDNINFEYIKLKTNFRSNNNIVSWVNRVFDKSFPKKIDLLFGAISYSRSDSFNKEITKDKVSINIFENDVNYVEEEFIVDEIQNILINNPQDKIAVLLKNRKHGKYIIKLLNEKNINFSAVDIDLLQDNYFIQDLLSLVKAMLFLSDNVAWFAILRAPWCGLLLEDLDIIANYDSDNSFIWEVINNQEVTANLTKDGQKRVANFITCFEKALNNRYLVKFYLLIKTLWNDLNGSIFIKSKEELDIINEFFDVISSFEKNNSILNPDEFYSKLEKLYFSPKDNQSSNIQIMTIHKSKGLQFDHVFVPMLHRTSKANDHELLLSQEYHAKNFNGFVLAPFNEYLDIDDSSNNIYNVLRYIDKQKSYHESIRLLYVAITRAKKSCFLTAVLDEKKIEKGPSKGSLLNCIWQGINLEDIKYHKSEITNNISMTKINNINLRVSSNFINNNLNKNIIIENNNNLNKNPGVYNYEENTSSLLGTYVHRLLKSYAENKEIILKQIFHNNYKKIIFEQLSSIGVSLNNLDYCYALILKVFNNIQNDKQADFIFKNYEDFANEQSYSYINNKSQISTIRIDRTFVDSKTNIRWIIDYKITDSLDDFDKLDQYRKQLEIYKNVFSHQQNDVNALIYLPLLSKIILL